MKTGLILLLFFSLKSHGWIAQKFTDDMTGKKSCQIVTSSTLPVYNEQTMKVYYVVGKYPFARFEAPDAFKSEYVTVKFDSSNGKDYRFDLSAGVKYAETMNLSILNKFKGSKKMIIRYTSVLGIGGTKKVEFDVSGFDAELKECQKHMKSK